MENNSWGSFRGSWLGPDHWALGLLEGHLPEQCLLLSPMGVFPLFFFLSSFSYQGKSGFSHCLSSFAMLFLSNQLVAFNI